VLSLASVLVTENVTRHNVRVPRVSTAIFQKNLNQMFTKLRPSFHREA